MARPPRSLSRILSIVFQRQPIEKGTDPLSERFTAARATLAEKQNDFRQVIEEVVTKIEKKGNTSNVGKGN